jgi:8-oxo-dGTP diphosphatase
MNIDGNPNKHYITIFMTGEVSEMSAELVNMEPHKCKEWIWMPWSDVCAMATSLDTDKALFDPLMHFVQEKMGFLA